MKRSITRWTTTLATAALLGLPAVGMAQTPQPPTEQPPATQPPAQPQATPPQQQTPPAQPTPAPQPTTAAQPPQADSAVSPQEHLRQAKSALDAIQPASVTGKARTQLTELRRHLNALDKASTATPSAAPGKANANANWGTEVAAIDKILTEMTAGDVPGATGTAGATGTSGNARSKAAAAVSLDEATRAKLTEVRTHITVYATAMAATPATPKSPGDAAANAPSAQPSEPTTPAGTTPAGLTAAAGAAAPAGLMTPGATPPAATPSTEAPSATAPQAAGAQPPAEATPQAGVDADAARRHLTAARDTLSQLTKLPAAAQLTGESRTQVGQLIANFNELITTQSQWRASYAKVAANLDSLLGPDGAAPAAMTPPAPEATPATPPAGEPPAATPGAVGTTGTASAGLDPGIREKLVELRNNLKEFEKASGGPEQK